MKDIIERIKELPAGRKLYLHLGTSFYDHDNPISTDDLKQMAEELAGYREMLEAADQIRKLDDGGAVVWSLEKFGEEDKWDAFSEDLPTCHSDALSAFKKLQEKS